MFISFIQIQLNRLFKHLVNNQKFFPSLGMEAKTKMPLLLLCQFPNIQYNITVGYIQNIPGLAILEDKPF